MLRNRLAFYDKETHKKFYVEHDQYTQTLMNGHTPSKSAIKKMNTIKANLI